MADRALEGAAVDEARALAREHAETWTEYLESFDVNLEQLLEAAQ